MKIINGDIESSILIMTEVAKWLIDKGEPLWEINDLTKEILLGNNLTEDNFYTGWECGKPIASMILQWHDPELWPNIEPFESGFIHKLCVCRDYAGKGISREMILFAELECKNKGIKKLRLDCAEDRSKLCNFYETYGFIKVDRKKIGIYDIAFYEKNRKGYFMEKPITTLFMLISVDGKISTRNIDDRDVDKDFPKITGIKEGLKQYYDIEQTTDLFSMNSGRVMAKVGSNVE